MLSRLLPTTVARRLRLRAACPEWLLLVVLLSSSVLPVSPVSGQETTSQDVASASFSSVLQPHWWIVTDDDFQASKDELWCTAAFNRLTRNSEPNRGHVRYLPSGAPRILNKQREPTGPRRAICFLTTETGLIRGLCIGIPQASHFTTLVEEAQELMLADSFQKPGLSDDKAQDTPPSAARQALLQRIERTTIRHYRPLLAALPPYPAIDETFTLSLPALQQDLAERFHLTPPVMPERLVAVQQHAESMKYWADFMLPCVIDRPVEEIWARFASMLWQAEPWQTEKPIEELLAWYDQSIQRGRIVIEVDYSRSWLDLKSSRQSGATSRKKEMLATALEEKTQLVEEVAGQRQAFRKISLPDLAVLWKQRNLPPLDLLPRYETEPIHWIVLDHPATKPQLFPAAGATRLYQLLERP